MGPPEEEKARSSLHQDDILTDTLQRVKKEQEESGYESTTSEEQATTVSETIDPAAEYVTAWHLAVVLAAVTAACFVMLLDTSIVATAIPKITNDFHALQDIGWYGSAFLLTNATLQPITGKLYAQFDSKIIFMIFLGIFELGSLLCGVAQSSTMFIIGRAVAGMGGAGILNGGLTIISACVPLQKRPAYLGFMLGILFGPIIGGALTEYTSWRWCFYINLPVGGLVGVLIFFIRIPDKRIKSQVKTTLPAILHSLDLPGIGLFAPTAIMFLLALEWGGNKYNWGSATIIGLFCGSAGMLVVFLVWEWKRGDTAMIPLSMLKRRIVWMSCVTLFFVSANMLITSYYMAIYFQSIRGKSPMLSGVYILPSILSQMFCSVGSGILVTRLGYYLPFSIASGAITAISAGLLSTLKPNTSTVAWVFYQIIGGVGRGLGLQMPLVAVQNHLPPALNSVGMSAIIFGQNFGAALFLSFAQTTLSAGLLDALPKFAPEVNFQTVINAGATGFRAVVPKDQVGGVILAYNQSVNHVFYLATGAAVGAFVFSWGTGWKSVKKAKKVEPEA